MITSGRAVMRDAPTGSTPPETDTAVIPILTAPANGVARLERQTMTSIDQPVAGFETYVTVPTVVTAIKLGPDTFASAMSWIARHEGVTRAFIGGDGSERMAVWTLEGEMFAEDGDYIIQAGDGSFTPMPAEVFERKYRRVEPKPAKLMRHCLSIRVHPEHVWGVNADLTCQGFRAEWMCDEAN